MINVYELVISQPGYFKQLSVKDMLFVQYQCPQVEKKMDLFNHYNFIIYTLSGKKLIHRPGKSWLLTEGVTLFIKKGAYIQERFDDAEWCILGFLIPDNYLKQLFTEYRLQLPLKAIPAITHDMMLDIHVNNTTQAFFYSILPYFSQQPPPPENLLELKFRELFFNILSNPNNANVLSYVNSISDCNKPPLEEIMETNYMYNLSIAEFAKITHRSLATFKRDFTEIYHTTPHKWLMQKRLYLAQLLLHTSQKAISEIACETGFESVTHFSRLFKEKFNVAPHQYRKRCSEIL